MQEQFVRTEILIGSQGLALLEKCHVAVFGIGGVGGHAAEALVRSGIGCIDLIDNDIINESNINRQIFATHSTIGQYKVDVAKMRLLDINPQLKVNTYNLFYMPETSSSINLSQYNYIIDAVDTVTAKIHLIVNANNSNVPIISSMGTGNKLNPCAFEVTDVYKTSVCPLAKVMRHELRKRDIKHLKVVYSKELPIVSKSDKTIKDGSRPTPGSISYVPSVAGLVLAGTVINDLISSI